MSTKGLNMAAIDTPVQTASEHTRETRDLLDKLSTEVMRPLVTQKEFVYIDVDLLYDFKLGGLISLIRHGEKDYNYIMKNLDAYVKAPSLECGKFFPELGITDEQIEARLADPKYKNQLAAIIPPTRFLFEMREIISVLNSLNASKETQRPLRVVINQMKHKLHPYIKRNLELNLKNIDRNMSIEFTEFESWNKIPESLLEKMDVICVYDLKSFLQQGTTSQKLLAETNKLGSTDILALKISELPEDETEEGLHNLKIVMEMMCSKFTFICKTILTSKDLTNG